MNEPEPPDDRTVRIAPPAAGGSASTGGSSDRLPVGTRLAEFEITGFVGEGGFSVVYLAWDHSLERRVALKEYMPSSLAARNSVSHAVAARSERHRETFDAGLKSFVNEGKLLAQFDHPSLVKVYRFWEQQGTAYMVMPFYEGVTLKDHVRALAAPPDEAWLRQLLGAVTAALSVLHRALCFHRDIAPDNIMLLADSGKPLLLDFGAARRVIGDKTQALTVILKPGYAPIEQYAEDPGMKQGA
jgi:serine/threonine protein kinase